MTNRELNSAKACVGTVVASRLGVDSLSDGQIGFSRWEHLENVNDVKLFAMNPDCTQMVALGGQHAKPGNSLVQVTESLEEQGAGTLQAPADALNASITLLGNSASSVAGHGVRRHEWRAKS